MIFVSRVNLKGKLEVHLKDGLIEHDCGLLMYTFQLFVLLSNKYNVWAGGMEHILVLLSGKCQFFWVGHSHNGT